MTNWFLKNTITTMMRRITAGAIAFLISFSALANPVVDNIAAGQVTIQQAPNSTVVNQGSQKAIINWQSFNIGQNESTHFNQPTGGITLNRINPSQGVSQIFGQLTATGQIILINPAGIHFGPSAFVNVGGLIATTHNITDANFLSGNFEFNRVDAYSGSIINEGTIIAAQHGLVALVAPGVVNNGMIQANMGKVVLASGNAFTMSFDGNGLVNFVINEATTSRGVDQNGNELVDGVKNTGSIIANGGSILVTGKAASGVLDHVINMEGLVQAKSVMENNGEIILSADTDEASDNIIRLAGILDASGTTAGLLGGNVTVTSKYILADDGMRIDVSGDFGGGNVWIGGNYKGQGLLPNATAIFMAKNTIIKADAISKGNGGEIILWSDNFTNIMGGEIYARGGAQSGNGGFVETSGHNILNVGDLVVNTYAVAGNIGTWLLDPTNIYIAANQGNATAAGMVGTNTSANTGTATFQATGAVADSLVLTGTLQTALGSTNVLVTTANGSGIGAGFMRVVDSISWSSTHTLTLTATTNLTVDSGASISYTGLGSGLIMNAGGNIVLNAAITNTTNAGNLTLNATGNVQIYQPIAILGAADFTTSSLQIITSGITSGGNQTYNASPIVLGQDVVLTSNSGDITASGTINGSSNRLTISNAGAASTLSGAMSNLISFTKNGSGALTLSSGTSSYSGNTTVSAGTLIIGASSNSGPLTQGPIGTGTLRLNTGSTLQSSGNFSLANAISILGNTTISGTNSLALNGVITFTGSPTLNIANTAGTITIGELHGNGNYVQNGIGGTAILSGPDNSAYSGTTTLTNGTLILDAASDVLGTNTFNFNGGTLQSNQAVSFNNTYIIRNTAAISGSNNITFNGASGSFNAGATISNSNTGTTTFSNSVSKSTSGYTQSNGGTTIFSSAFNSGSAGTITASGGTIRFSGNNSNLTAAITATASGILQANNSTNPFGTGSLTLNTGSIQALQSTSVNNGSIAISNGASGTISGAQDIIFNNAISYGNGSSQLNVTNTGQTTLFGLTGAGNLVINSTSGTLNAAGDNGSYSGAITLTSGNLQLANGNAFPLGFGSLSLNGGTLLGNATSFSVANAVTVDNNSIIGGVDNISFNNTVGFASGRTLTISNTLATTFTGAISGASNTVLSQTAGTLNLNASNTGFSGTTTVASGALLNVNNNAALGTGTATISSGGTINLANGINLGSLTTLNLNGAGISSNGVLTSTGSSAIANTVGVVLQSTSTLGVASGSDTLTINGVISSTGGLTKIGAGALLLTGVNTYSGATTINEGAISIGADSGLGTAPGVATPGHLAINDGTLITTAGFTLNSNRGISLGASGGIFNTTGTLIYNGIIAGVGSLTKSTGTGTLQLGGVNTYTGITTINAGTISIAADSGLGAAPGVATPDQLTLNGGSLYVSQNLTLNANRGITLGASGGVINVGANVIIPGQITGTGSLTTISTNVTSLTLSGNNTYDGQTIVSGNTNLIAAHVNALGSTVSGTTVQDTGTLAIDNVHIGNEAITLTGSGVSFSGALRGLNSAALDGDVSSSGTVYVGVAPGSTLDLYGAISTTGGLSLVSAGTLVLYNTANAFSSITMMGNGTLQWGASNIIPDTASIFFTAGIGNLLDLNGFNDTVGYLNGGNSSVENILLSGGGTLTVNQTTNATFDGGIGGDGNFVKAGSSRLTLTGTHSYTGTTTINNGTLRLNAVDAIVNSSSVTLANTSGAILDFNNNNNAINNLSGGGALGGNITLGSGTLTVTQGSDQTYGGVISGSGGLIKAGASALILSGTNLYTGTTTINAGTLRLGASNVIANNSAIVLADVAGATFDLNGNSDTVGTLSGGGATGGNITLGSGTLTVTQGSDQTYDGVISGSGGLTKAGASALILSRANLYTGATTINDGVLRLGGSNIIADGSAIVLANAAGATFDLNGNNDTVGTLSGGGALGGNITLGSGTLTVTQGSDQVYDGVISGTGGLTKEGANSLTLSRANLYTGTTTINAGTLRLGVANAIDVGNMVLANTANATFDINNFNITIGALSGGGALGGNIILGSGTLTIVQDSDQTYDGVISGTGGITKEGANTLILSRANLYTGATTINDGVLRLGGSNIIADGSAIVLANAAGATFDLNGNNDTVGTLSGGGVTGGNITLGAGTLTVTQTTDQIYAGVISGVGGNVIKAGASNLTLSGNNSFDGSFTLSAGTVTAGNDNAFGNGTLILNSGTLLANATRTLNNVFVIGGAVNIGDGTGDSDIEFTNNGTLNSGLTLASDATITFSGDLDGANGITQSSGIVDLSGNNTYTGAVVVNGGTLNANSANALGTTGAGTSVNSGGTLAINSAAIGAEAITLNNGTLNSSGTSSLAGAITLAASSTNTMSSSGAFTIGNNINGAGALSMSGAGSYVLDGNIGNSTAVASLASSTATSFTGTNTVNATGTIAFNNTLNGGSDLTLTSGSTTTLGGAVGGGIPLNSLTISASGINVNGGAITTVGNQTYNGTLTAGAPTTLTTTNAGLTTVAFNSGVAGSSNIAVSGNAAGTNTLIMNASGGANWSITSSNGGGIAGMTGYSGAFSFANMRNLTGGNGNDNFTLNGGTVAGNIVGGAGTNSLTADNTTNTWNISAANTGAVTGVGGTFSAIQNITGGSGIDNFTLNGGTLSGNLAGGGGTNTLVADNVTNTWSITGANAGAVTGISGTFSAIQNITGGSGIDNFTLNGGTLSGDVAGGGGTNTLAADNTTNTWNITGANTGAVTGIGGTFSAIQNLTGGSGNDNFTLAGGTLSGTILGGAGTNTLTADNVSNTWNLSGMNAATSMTGITSGFSSIQNLVGGTGDDHFIFANGASITGTISGGVSLINNGNNILDFTAYSTLVNAYMTSDTDTFIGNIRNSGNSMIANYSNIDRLIGNEFTDNVLTLPAGKDLSVVTFDFGTTRSGSIGDPLYFEFFRIVGQTPTPPPPDPTPTPTPTNPTVDVAQIVQQPTTNGTNNVNAPSVINPGWVNSSSSLTQNITEISNQASQTYDSDLDSIKINPYCTTTTGN